jgi:hypothetical protein
MSPMRAMVLVFAAFVGACSSQQTKVPAELANCVPPPDASCSTPAAGSNGTGAVGSGTATSDGATSATCGVADSIVNMINVYCPPCIVSLCCMTDQLCDQTCQSLLVCTQKCSQGDMTCVGMCENLWPEGVTAYLDFANCLSGSCPACPTLQHL